MKKQEEILIEQITQIAIEAYKKTEEQEQKKKQDKRLHNTKLLLEHYREFKMYVNEIDKGVKTEVPKIQVEEDKNIIDLITFGDDLINSIKVSTKKTIAMIQYLDKALDALEYIYKQEKNERYYQIVKRRYIDGESISSIASCYDLNSRTVYKIIDRVAERLSVLLFGIYGIKIV